MTRKAPSPLRSAGPFSSRLANVSRSLECGGLDAAWGPHVVLALVAPIAAFTFLSARTTAGESGASWTRHAVDNSSKGSDGVRLADINGDGLPDVTAGWEEAGLVRVYLHPGKEKVREPWPMVTVGKVRNVEDAVFADLDGDGAVDVVSSCEGETSSIFIHWSPKDRSKLLDPDAWKTETVPSVQGACKWRYCEPMQVDGKHGLDLVIGSAGKKDPEHTKVGWLESPAEPRDLAAWRYHPIYDASVIMSIVGADMDGDGDQDIVLSDRSHGCLWLENPGPGPAQTQYWTKNVISTEMAFFLTLKDLDQDGLVDVLLAQRNGVGFNRRKDPSGKSWEHFKVGRASNTGLVKAVEAGDIDLDGKMDLAVTTDTAGGERRGVYWQSYREAPTDLQWSDFDIGGTDGDKFDRMELIDLDGDGDLDLITTEEVKKLGVIWYENPTRNGKQE